MSTVNDTLAQGRQHHQAGNLAEAERLYRQVLVDDPRQAEAWCHLGIVQFQQHRLDEAVRCFRGALALQPQFPDALIYLGNALFYQGKLAEAGECYRQALQVRPNDPRAMNQLAVVYRMQQKWTEAETLLRHSLAVHATDSRTHHNLAALFHEQGQMAEARTWYQRVLMVAPQEAEVRFLADALGDQPPPQVPAQMVTAMFDAYAESFDQDLVERLEYRGPELLKAALSPVPGAHTFDILDLGCGTGLCGLQFRDWAKTLTGVDLSGRMLDKARERSIYDVLIQSDLLPALNERPDQYDLILAGDVLIYLGELSPLFQAVARSLRSGGRFAFTVERIEGNRYQILATGRFAHSRPYLQHLVRLAGLQEISMEAAAIRRKFGKEIPGLVVVLTKP